MLLSLRFGLTELDQSLGAFRRISELVHYLHRLNVSGLWFVVWGVGFGIWDFGFGVWGLEFGFLGFEVCGLGFGVLGLGFGF